MAWTNPRNWLTGETVTAAIMNAHVRDNLLETAPGKATTAGALFVATGANAIMQTAVPQYMAGDTTYTGAGVTDNTFFTLVSSAWGSGTNVAVTLTTSTRALLMYGVAARSVASQSDHVILSYDVSGATTIAASTVWSTALLTQSLTQDIGMGRMHYRSDLNAGSNTFRLAVRSSDTSDTVLVQPYIFVMAL